MISLARELCKEVCVPSSTYHCNCVHYDTPDDRDALREHLLQKCDTSNLRIVRALLLFYDSNDGDLIAGGYRCILDDYSQLLAWFRQAGNSTVLRCQNDQSFFETWPLIQRRATRAIK